MCNFTFFPTLSLMLYGSIWGKFNFKKDLRRQMWRQNCRACRMFSCFGLWPLFSTFWPFTPSQPTSNHGCTFWAMLTGPRWEMLGEKNWGKMGHCRRCVGPSVIARIGPELMAGADVPRAQQKYGFSKIRLSRWTQVPKFSGPGRDTIDLVGNYVTGIDRSSDLKIGKPLLSVC